MERQFKILENENLGLATLTGSEKQVSWAEKIREEKLNEIEEHSFYDTTLEATKAQNPERYAQKIAALAAIKKINSAKWWINVRFENESAILKAAMKNRLETIG